METSIGATITLIRVNIGPNKTFSTFNVDGNLVTQEVATVPLDKDLDPTFAGSLTRISFDTVTGKLEDNQYATQENGFHWVKIPGYALIKINPEFISKDILSQAGITFIQTQSSKE